jgi:hypothetical protein
MTVSSNTCMLQFGEKKCRNYNRKLYLRSTWRLLMAWQKHFQCTQVSIWPGLSTAPVTVLSRRRFCSWFWCNHFLGQRIVSFCSVIRTFSVLVLFCKNIVSPLAHNIPWIVWTASCWSAFLSTSTPPQTGPNFEFELYWFTFGLWSGWMEKRIHIADLS